MNINPNSMPEQMYDDLTTIKGIKQVRQQWFRNTFNVRTFGDLAALSVDEIEARLKAEKQIPSRSKIEAWLTEARYLAENPALVIAMKNSAAARLEGWKPFASFVVEFQKREGESGTQHQTCVHHIENDKTNTWNGIEHNRLCEWVAAQIDNRETHVPLRFEVQSPETEPEVRAEPASPPIQKGDSDFSPRLQTLIQKVRRANEPPPPTYHTHSVIPVPAALPQREEANRSEGGFSVKLQRLINKTEQLASTRRGK